MSLRNQFSALASLTATYTDSEGEDEPEVDGLGDDRLGSGNSKSPETSSGQSAPDTPSKATFPVAPLRLARLVSYQDEDAIVSEEDQQRQQQLLVHHQQQQLQQQLPLFFQHTQQMHFFGNDLEDEDKMSGDDNMDHLDIDDEEIDDHFHNRQGGEDDIRLPPEPIGRCTRELQDKIARLHERKVQEGMDMNEVIQSRKAFRNPSIYEKLIQFCCIDEMGTNYPADVYDPHQWGPQSYYEELAKVQKVEMDKREKEKKERTKVEFVSGTAKKPSEDEMKKRKSKWDQVGTHTSSGVPLIKPAGLLQQATLTTSATGTKSTVISAFGSLPKKPKV